MKTIINTLLAIVLLLAGHSSLHSQSKDQNYILTRTMTNAAGTTSCDVVQYYDGLGRPSETVKKRFGINTRDVREYQDYDNFGRPSKTWVPIPYNTYDGQYIGTPAAIPTYNDAYYYTETVYEASPLNRPVQVWNPGKDWRTNNRSVRTEYLSNTNTSPLSCAYYYLSGNNLVRSNNYASGQLYVTKMTDEDNHVAYEFRDKQYRVVLERRISNSLNHDTYYIYDDRNNLAYVLPPLAADPTGNGTYNEATPAIDKYAYLYRYDERNRCVEKKLPGISWTYYVYDKADRLRMIQDPDQRTRREWTYNKYDALGRLLVTGTIVRDVGRDAMKNNVEANTTLFETLSGSHDGNYFLYTNNSYPTTNAADGTNRKELATNYYDNYNFVYSGSTLNTPLAYTPGYSDAEYTTSTKGLLTGSRSALLDESGKYIYRHTRYDDQARPIQAKSTNILNDVDYEFYKYSYTGQVIEKNIKTKNDNLAKEKYTYTYDSWYRLSSSNYTLNSNPAKTSTYGYDYRGQIVQKNLGGLETMYYNYNLRGWLTRILCSQFIEELFYTTKPFSYSDGATYFNGNIAAIRWRDIFTPTYLPPSFLDRGYSFVYDELDRMTNAGYGEGLTMLNNRDRYNENYNYDKHGNVNQIVRHGRYDNMTYGVIDLPSVISYDGNRWSKVMDNYASTQNAADIMEFPRVWDAQYMYDALGRMTVDGNKKISKIEYNSLSLPRRMTMATGDKIENVYDASGVKHQTIHNTVGSKPSVLTTTYAANKVLENGTLTMLLNEDGYTTHYGTTDYYYYYIKDHLGNNRLVVCPPYLTGLSGTQEVQRISYYPFGMTLAGSGQGGQPYKFGGKELDRTYGVDLYDSQARMYCPSSGRFTTMDPLLEKYYATSPYANCGNNPVNRIDPTGMTWDDAKEAEKLKGNIDRRINSLIRHIAKNQVKLDKGGLNDKQISKLESKISEANNRIANLNTSKSDVDVLGADQNNVYALSNINGGEHKVRQGSDGKVYIETSSDAISIHEITHVRQSLDAGGLKFSAGGELHNAGVGYKGKSEMEVEAYKMQYSYDLSFPGRTSSLQGIDVHSVGNITNPAIGIQYPFIKTYSDFLKKQQKLGK